MTRDELYEKLNDIILGCGGDVDDAMEHVDSYAAAQRAEIEQQIADLCDRKCGVPR